MGQIHCHNYNNVVEFAYINTVCMYIIILKAWAIAVTGVSYFQLDTLPVGLKREQCELQPR